MRFEKQLARALPKALHGQWFEYRDGSGPGWCQMDLLLVGAKQVVVIEAKLTNWEEAQAQLSNLYLPVLSSAYPEKKVKGVIALRHLSRVPRETLVHERLSSAMLSPEPFPIFHWLGKGPVD